MLSLLLALSLHGPPASTATSGEQRTAVLLVNFRDDASQPITHAAAHALVFGTVSDFYREASYRKTYLSGDVHGYFTVPLSVGDCATDEIADLVEGQAAARGVDLTKYRRFIYLMRNTGCSIAGANSGVSLPSRAWINSDGISAQLIVHELGHNFGLLHAQSRDCGAAVLGSPCASNVYGDPADAMGSGATAHFNAIHKERLGWLGAPGQPSIAIVMASGRHRVAPLETPGTSSPKALRIPRGVDPATGQASYYYVEYRQPVGFDARLGRVGNLVAGVLVRIGGNQQRSELLDMTPDSQPASAYHDIRDAALAPGRSYTDPIAGITLEVVSADAAGAVVDVEMRGTTQRAMRRPRDR